jgi:hypothetical protein
MHLGSDKWMIVDSCLNGRTGEQPALKYMDSLGVSPEAVELVVATHWHADHIRGLTKVVQACVNARFVITEAYTAPELLIAADQWMAVDKTEFNAFRELHGVMEVLKTRKLGAYAIPDIETASAGKRLFPGGRGLDVQALSPSPAETQRARQSLATRLAPAVDGIVRAISPPAKNNASIAIWVELGSATFLLGSDLEELADPGRGWNGAVARLGAVRKKAAIVKVPHHGSSTAHSSKMWAHLVESDAIAAVTPFTRAVEPLPTSQDIARIRSLAGRMYLTAAPKLHPPVKQNDPLTTRMKQSTRSLHEIEALPGRVTLRGPLALASSSQIKVELIKPARVA